MRRLKVFIILFSILVCSSCAMLLPTSSRFPMDKISLGTSKAEVKKLCGVPFRTDMFTRGQKKIEVLYYKEPARVETEEFIITTALTFENDSLVSVIQKDRPTSGINLSVDSIQRR